jgi:GTP pyrophosphokinase
LTDGKSIYEHEIKRQGIRPDVDQLVRNYKQKSVDDFYVSIGRGDISVTQLSAALHEQQLTGRDTDIPIKPGIRSVRSARKKKSINRINVLGVGNLLTTIANCCRPVPGDEIIGFITKGKGVSIHRMDCSNIINLQEDDRGRLIEVEWGDADIETYPVSLVIRAMDRHGLLSDITSTLADDKVNVIAVNTLSDKKKQTARMAVTVEIRDLEQLTRIMDKVAQLPNVTEVMRGANAPK